MSFPEPPLPFPSSSSGLPGKLILDFDGTITECDTIGNIGKAALAWQDCDEDVRQGLTAQWEDVVSSYFQDLAAYDASQPPQEQRRTVEHELAYLRGRRAVEQASLARVAELGLFRGPSGPTRLFEAGQRDRIAGTTTLRPGFSEWIEALQQSAQPVPSLHVVSVNFSVSYIKGVLQPWLYAFSSVTANELQPDGSISRDSSLAIPTAHDAHTAWTTCEDKAIATSYLSTQIPGSVKAYFGDSTTDIECLMRHGGYVLDSDGQGTLLSTLRRLGYAVPHTSDSGASLAEKRICWARDFHEVPQV
ncbi:hypothetical protein BD289DRAFT_431552 [Coniella lustricola]|uniref:HAD-like domain-containing protein n=1 Tax=Coniella lustricola TaxID=2025994 RepID=A0A2T3AAX4_9PEZI|nr:hypothetical protein BD289DRAFT_431552 [Coniella lustricola]